MWAEKYKPKNLDGFLGNPMAISQIKEWKLDKPLLIHGSPGVGKSALVEAVTDHFNLDLVEVSEDNIEDAENIASTSTLFGERKLILIDNVDSVSDIKLVAELLKESKNPIVLLTSDVKSQRLKTIKTLCVSIGLKRPRADSLAKYLACVCKSEGVAVEGDVLLKIAENAGGDVRAALNDLETIAKDKKKLTPQNLGVLGGRDTKEDIYAVLSLIYRGKNLGEIVNSTMDLDEQPNEVIMWIDETTPRVYTTRESLAKSFHYLARADVFLGRIMRRQQWSFLRYVSPLMTGGVNASKPDRINSTMYQFPSYLIKLSQTKKNRALENSIGEKLSPLLHVSSKTVAEQYIPLVRIMLKKKILTEEDLMETLRLSEEETEFIKS